MGVSLTGAGRGLSGDWGAGCCTPEVDLHQE